MSNITYLKMTTICLSGLFTLFTFCSCSLMYLPLDVKSMYDLLLVDESCIFCEIKYVN